MENSRPRYVKADLWAICSRQPNKRLILAGALYYLIVVGAMAGCAGNTGENRARSHTVEIRAMQFHPAVINVQAGDTIVFLNRDIVAHNVREKAGGAWGTTSLAPGDTWRTVVRKTVDYYCSLHPVMEGRVVTE